MDLNDIWQSHKRFILTVGCALVAVLIVQGIIGSMWNVEARTQAVQRLQSKLRKLEAPPQQALSSVQAENLAMKEQLDELYGRMSFQVEDKYLLAKDEPSPDLLYNSIRSTAQDELVGSAAKRNIRVDESLGLEEFTPSGREAIQRALRGLQIVEQVVGAAIVAGVRAVPEIEVIGRQGRRRKQDESFIDPLRVRFRVEGGTAAVAELLQTLVQGDGPYLCVEEAEFDLDQQETFGSTGLSMVVAGLTIDPEAPVTGGGTR